MPCRASEPQAGRRKVRFAVGFRALHACWRYRAPCGRSGSAHAASCDPVLRITVIEPVATALPGVSRPSPQTGPPRGPVHQILDLALRGPVPGTLDLELTHPASPFGQV